MRLDRGMPQFLANLVNQYRAEFVARFSELLGPVVRGVLPPTVKAYVDDILHLYSQLSAAQASFELAEAYGPLLREIVIQQRLFTAEHIEERRSHAIHPDLLKILDEELRLYDEIIRASWFQHAEPKSVPQLTDFFPVELIETKLAKEQGSEPQREYDEKFHILQSPRQFLRDLRRARKAAALRGILVVAAYIDIDKFKDFNTEKGEPYVDRYVLPKFMRLVEAHVYARGYAYRFGGDEYCILLNNVTDDEAFGSMERLRRGLAELTYEGTERRTTVSIGVVIVRPDCHLTGHEIEQVAAAAKKFAKDNGRNRVASYVGSLFREEDLHVVGRAGV